MPGHPGRLGLGASSMGPLLEGRGWVRQTGTSLGRGQSWVAAPHRDGEAGVHLRVHLEARPPHAGPSGVLEPLTLGAAIPGGRMSGQGSSSQPGPDPEATLRLAGP